MEEVLVLSNGMLLAIQDCSEGESVADYTILEKPGEVYDGGRYTFKTGSIWKKAIVKASEHLLRNMHPELEGVTVVKSCEEWSFEDLMDSMETFAY